MRATPGSLEPAPAASSDVTTADDASSPLAGLNEAQRLAVEHGVTEADTRALLVVAGPGSGKTNTLAHRVAHLIRHGADPQRLLLLTFSRRAAAEMERRAGSVLLGGLGIRPQAPPSLPWAGTFHAIGARLLREYAGRIGLDDSFTIQDRADSEDLLALVRNDLGFASKEKRFPQKGTCLAIYSRVVNGGEPLASVLQTTFPWCGEWEPELKTLFGGYVDAKQRQNVLDYDDLLLFWSDMMSDADLAAEVGARFDHVLVDEYQDTNLLQSAILRGLKPSGHGITVVGDDAQSIYGFRGATVRNILDFPTHFTQPVRVVTLEQNYRSTPAILAVSNAVIAGAAQRYCKTMWTDKAPGSKPQLVAVPDEAEQARWVAGRVLQNREAGVKLRSQAVLFRTSSHSAALELELIRRNVPYVKFGGLKFLEASHIKDMLAILRFAQNPRGRLAGFRVLQLIPGIGHATATRLLDELAEAAAPQAVIEAFKVARGAHDAWQEFVGLYRRLREPALQWPADMDLAKRWYEPQLQRLHDDAAVRLADVDNLERMASAYRSRERFLSEITLDPPAATSDQSGPPLLDEDYLILSTIHSAKGQEWSSVFVLNVVDGCIPSDLGTGSQAEVDEERRLLYVAMTRARHDLHLVVPHRFYVHQQSASGDRHVYAQRSRFIPPVAAEAFEQAIWPVGTPEGPRLRVIGSTGIQVRDRARAAWR